VEAPEFVQHRAGGVDWSVCAGDLQTLVPWLDSVTNLESAPGAEAIKRSRTRTVTRLRPASPPSYILKEYRVDSPLDSLKERWVRSAARTEWKTLLGLAGLGVAVSRAVAFGRPTHRTGDIRAYVILEEVPAVRSVKDHYNSLGPSLEAPCAFAADLGRFVRSFHDAGVVHNDLHGGNILVRAEPAADGNRFVLIDLQRTRIGSAASNRSRAVDLAMLGQAFRGAAPDRVAVRTAFLKGYCSGPPRLDSPLLTLESIDARIAKIRATRTRSRGRRCLVDSSKYAIVLRCDVRAYHRRDYDFEAVLALAELDVPPPADVHVRAWDGPGGALLEVRVYPASVRWFRRSRAVEEYVAAHGRHVADKSLPRPVAAIEVLRGPRKGTSVVIEELRQPPTT